MRAAQAVEQVHDLLFRTGWGAVVASVFYRILVLEYGVEIDGIGYLMLLIDDLCSRELAPQLVDRATHASTLTPDNIVRSATVVRVEP